MPHLQGGWGWASTEDGLPGRAFGDPGDLALKDEVIAENSDQGRQRLARGASMQRDPAMPQLERPWKMPLALHPLVPDYKAKQFSPCKHVRDSDVFHTGLSAQWWQSPGNRWSCLHLNCNAEMALRAYI